MLLPLLAVILMSFQLSDTPANNFTPSRSMSLKEARTIPWDRERGHGPNDHDLREMRATPTPCPAGLGQGEGGSLELGDPLSKLRSWEALSSGEDDGACQGGGHLPGQPCHCLRG